MPAIPRTLMERFGFRDGDLLTPRHDEMLLWLDENADVAVGMAFPDWSDYEVYEPDILPCEEHMDVPDRPRVYERTWEYPITAGNYIVGFVDMLARVEMPNWREDEICRFDALFEIKTEIPSLGELVRQIQMYRVYLPKARPVIVSPDARFAEPLARQGIRFLHCVYDDMDTMVFVHGGPCLPADTPNASPFVALCHAPRSRIRGVDL